MAIALVSGCSSDSAAQRRAISGHVTFKGKPLEHGNIQFLFTDAGQGAGAGAAIQNGAYRIPASHGLTPGTYRVLISSGEIVKNDKDVDPAGRPLMRLGREVIPPQYNSRSTVKVEVRAVDDNTVDFTIE